MQECKGTHPLSRTEAEIKRTGMKPGAVRAPANHNSSPWLPATGFAEEKVETGKTKKEKVTNSNANQIFPATLGLRDFARV